MLVAAALNTVPCSMESYKRRHPIEITLTSSVAECFYNSASLHKTKAVCSLGERLLLFVRILGI